MINSYNQLDDGKGLWIQQIFFWLLVFSFLLFAVAIIYLGWFK